MFKFNNIKINKEITLKYKIKRINNEFQYKVNLSYKIQVDVIDVCGFEWSLKYLILNLILKFIFIKNTTN